MDNRGVITKDSVSSQWRSESRERKCYTPCLGWCLVPVPHTLQSRPYSEMLLSLPFDTLGNGFSRSCTPFVEHVLLSVFRVERWEDWWPLFWWIEFNGKNISHFKMKCQIHCKYFLEQTAKANQTPLLCQCHICKLIKNIELLKSRFNLLLWSLWSWTYIIELSEYIYCIKGYIHKSQWQSTKTLLEFFILNLWTKANFFMQRTFARMACRG